MPREDQIIERIARRLPSASGGALRLGVGDDAAVIRSAAGSEWVVSCDGFLEGVHFLAGLHPPDVVGYKALARAASDLVAMGARPELFLLGLVLPGSRTGRWLDQMLGGMAQAARRFGLRLAGGDTTKSPGASGRRIALHLTVLGQIAAGRAVRRDGARPGDAIFVSGQLGAAQLGLEIVLRGMRRQSRWRPLLTAHERPELPLALGLWLAKPARASAMMDLSDGLSSDLGRLCEASGVAARIEEDRLPVAKVPAALRNRGFDARAFALHGGEDYGLLFTVRKADAKRIPGSFGGVRVTRIGEIVRGHGVRLTSAQGSATPLAPLGWDPFRKS